MTIPSLDWFLLAVLLVSFLLGAWRGLVKEFFALISWGLALVLAQRFAPAVIANFPLNGLNEGLRYAASFAMVFVGVVLVCGLLSGLLRALLSKTGMGGADRSLGAVFGLMRGVLLLLVLTLLVGLTGFKDSDMWRVSDGAKILTSTLIWLRPNLPQDLGRYFPDEDVPVNASPQTLPSVPSRP